MGSRAEFFELSAPAVYSTVVSPLPVDGPLTRVEMFRRSLPDGTPKNAGDRISQITLADGILDRTSTGAAHLFSGIFERSLANEGRSSSCSPPAGRKRRSLGRITFGVTLECEQSKRISVSSSNCKIGRKRSAENSSIHVVIAGSGMRPDPSFQNTKITAAPGAIPTSAESRTVRLIRL